MPGRDNPKRFTRSKIYDLLAGVKERIPEVKVEVVDATMVKTGNRSVDEYGSVVYLDGDQPVESNAYTQVKLGKAEYDERGEVDLDNNKIVASERGKYSFSASTTLQDLSSADQLIQRVLVNSRETLRVKEIISQSGTGTVPVQLNISNLHLEQGDEVTFEVYHDEGTQQSILSDENLSRFSAVREA